MLKAVAHRVLSVPFMFDFYQWLVGSPNCQRHFMHDYVAAKSGMRILDIGCGVGAGLRYLPADIDYMGIDISSAYIEQAKKLHGTRGQFVFGDITKESPETYAPFDIAYAFGVLHHLNDDQARRLIAFVCGSLKPGGKFFSMEPCYHEGQDWVRRFFLDNDRGDYVRDAPHYRALFAGQGTLEETLVEDVMRIPYTQIILQFSPSQKSS